jgi:hypothetical protein
METHRPIDKRLLSLILSERLPDSAWHSLSPTDWESIVHLAKTEGAGPLLYAELSRAGRVGLLPKPLQASLRALYFSIRMKNEQTIQELGALTSLFEQAGIPVVALKGICFALTIYPDTGVRPMVDLDLLVPTPKHSEALRLVQTLGYEAALPEASPGLDALLNHAVCLKKRTRPFTVLELHTTLVAEETFTHAVPVDWFWSQTEPLQSLGGRNDHPHLLMLTPTAQLLYACAHAMLQHGGRYTSLHWLYDLDRLVQVYADRLDWDLFLAQAQAFAWSSAALAALSESVSLFETPVPPAVLDRLSHTSDRNAERVAALQSAPATHTLEEYQKLQALNWTGKLRLILALVIPAPAYMRWRYGLNTYWTLPAWYIYRWWEILKDALRTMLLVAQKIILPAQPKNGGTLERSTQKNHP